MMTEALAYGIPHLDLNPLLTGQDTLLGRHMGTQSLPTDDAAAEATGAAATPAAAGPSTAEYPYVLALQRAARTAVAARLRAAGRL